jgi:gamma-glutamyltranspeptidase/glutathione hydrolase
MKLITGLLAVLLFSCTSTSVTRQSYHPFDYSIQKNTIAEQGAVVSAHPLASKVGISVMKKGGNAFDAAIATQLALAVVYPGAGNIGGGGFLVARTETGELVSLDFRETAPMKAHRDMYLDSSGNIIAGRSLRSPTSSGVPGTVAGLFETMKFARLPFSELIKPAIDLAENGFAITEREAAALNGLQSEFSKFNTGPTAFQRPQAWKKGDTLVQKDLASTLKRILTDGKKGFYEGITADLVVNQMNSGMGYITHADLKNYQAKWRMPHRFQYKEYDIVSMGPPSSGGVLLNQMLTMASFRDISRFSHLSAAAVQLMVEVERRAYADRAQYLGDTDFFPVPVDTLVSRSYLQGRMLDFVEGRAGNSDLTKAGHIQIKESEQTTHLSVIDNRGNAVAVTTTLNDSYGSKTVVQGAGFLLNNEMDDFSIKPGEPNLYGAIGGNANAIEPGKRMLSSMTPTIVLKDSLPFLVLGTPGGTTIPTSVFQTIVNIIDFNLPVVEAVNKPKFHHQWRPDEVFVERSFPDSTMNTLTGMGYRLKTYGEIGRTEVIKVREDKKFEAVGDIRGDDHAEGY